MVQQIDVQKAIAWLNNLWHGNKQCPICKNNNWTVNDVALELTPYSAAPYPPVSYPLFSITCGVCGHTLLFNAILAGLLSAENTVIIR